ncbi:myoferlin-like [Apodemus sylvaticus]|uniref:myoferlin-like n=1 Tax=Apodemus sylvaticus TaxID=10129 RepID=UPI002243AA41|nr:myoferlin-like [Apodemus sylvaticus]
MALVASHLEDTRGRKDHPETDMPPDMTQEQTWAWEMVNFEALSHPSCQQSWCCGPVNPSIDTLLSEAAFGEARKYLRRLKYSLSAVFHSAIMLQEVGEVIQFEVSIGNYGNKFDATCNPLASTTQYSRAVFDGNYYYYLPWAHTKPIVTLTSYWEDISYRLDAVNTLLVMAEWLQSNIEAVKSGIQGKIPANQLAEVWLQLIDEVIEDMRYSNRPPISSSQHALNS